MSNLAEDRKVAESADELLEEIEHLVLPSDAASDSSTVFVNDEKHTDAVGQVEADLKRQKYLAAINSEKYRIMHLARKGELTDSYGEPVSNPTCIHFTCDYRSIGCDPETQFEMSQVNIINGGGDADSDELVPMAVVVKKVRQRVESHASAIVDSMNKPGDVKAIMALGKQDKVSSRTTADLRDSEGTYVEMVERVPTLEWKSRRIDVCPNTGMRECKMPGCRFNHPEVNFRAEFVCVNYFRNGGFCPFGFSCKYNHSYPELNSDQWAMILGSYHSDGSVRRARRPLIPFQRSASKPKYNSVLATKGSFQSPRGHSFSAPKGSDLPRGRGRGRGGRGGRGQTRGGPSRFKSQTETPAGSGTTNGPIPVTNPEKGTSGATEEYVGWE